MSPNTKLAAALERLAKATQAAEAAERRANTRTAVADATIADAKARIEDAEAQTAHADSHMTAAKAHMEAARATMANARESQDLADEQMADAAAIAEEESYDSAEYRRALYHYQQLVRHRIANPLQVILGMAETLLHDTENRIDEATRREMLQAIEDQAHVLERLTLFSVKQQSQEERDLHSRPFEDD